MWFGGENMETGSADSMIVAPIGTAKPMASASGWKPASPSSMRPWRRSVRKCFERNDGFEDERRSSNMDEYQRPEFIREARWLFSMRS